MKGWLVIFYYEAVDGSGQGRSGLLEASSSEVALSLLREKGLFPTAVREATDEERAPGGIIDSGKGSGPASPREGDPQRDGRVLGSGMAACDLVEGPGSVSGELDILTHGGDVYVVFFALPQRTESENEYLRIAFPDIEKATLRGLLWKALVIETKSGARHEFRGKVARFHEMLRFEMRQRGMAS